MIFVVLNSRDAKSCVSAIQFHFAGLFYNVFGNGIVGFHIADNVVVYHEYYAISFFVFP